MMKFKLEFLVLPIFFPWLGSALNSFDTQPWLLFYLLFLLFVFCKIRLSEIVISLAFVGILFFYHIIYVDDIISNVRGLVGVSVFAVSFVLFTMLSRRFELWPTIYLANIIYLTVGLMQFLSGEGLVSGLVEIRTSAGRGVTSLTPEPTFFGLVLVYFFIFFFFFHRKPFLAFLNVFFILFIAKSTSALLALSLILCVMFFSIGGLKGRLSVLLACCSLIFLPFAFDLGRLSDLMRAPFDLLFVISRDFSVLVRLSDIVSPSLMLIHNWLLPVPFDEVSRIREIVTGQNFDGIFYYHSTANKTNSFLGEWLLASGIIGVGLIIFFTVLAHRVGRLPAFLSTLALAVFSLPLNSVFIPSILGLFLNFRRPISVK